MAELTIGRESDLPVVGLIVFVQVAGGAVRRKAVVDPTAVAVGAIGGPVHSIQGEVIVLERGALPAVGGAPVTALAIGGETLPLMGGSLVIGKVAVHALG